MVQAARGGSQAGRSAMTHVELTAQAAARLQQCSANLRLDTIASSMLCLDEERERSVRPGPELVSKCLVTRGSYSGSLHVRIKRKH